MLERLKGILSRGVVESAGAETEHMNKGLIFKGKSEAFKEVLYIIESIEAEITLTEDEKEDENSTTESK